MDTFADRLSDTMQRQGRTAQWVANRCGVSRQAVGQWMEGKTKDVKAEALIKAADALGVSARWLLFGESGGDAVRDEGGHAYSIAEQDRLDGYTLVPRLQAVAGLGSGQEIQSEQITDALAFRTTYLQTMGVSPGSAICIRCRGDSMQGTISDGGVALVDTSQRSGNGVFALSRPGVGDQHEVLVKRLTARMDGSLLITSDNPDKNRYPDETIPPGYDLEALHIIGRVVWSGGNVH